MSSSSMAAAPRRAAVAFIFITVMLDMLALGIIIPVMPKLVVSFVGGDEVRGAWIYGTFGFVWALMQFFASPVLGALSDRFGRRPVILASNLGLGFDYMLMAAAPALWVLFIGRVVSGVMSASISTAFAYIADITEPERRAAAFGMLGAAFGVGFVLGPAVGGLLGGFDPRLPFWVAAGFSLANAAYGYFVLPESLKPAHRSPFVLAKANPVGSLKLLRAHPGLVGLAGAQFLGQLAHVALPTVFVLYAAHRYGWQEGTVGFTLAAVGICSVVVQAGLVRPIVKALGEPATLVSGLLLGAAGFAIYGLAPTGALFWIGIPVMALWGLAGPAAQTLMTSRVPPTDQGKLQGANSSLQGIAGIIGPLIFAPALAWGIDPASSLSLPGLPFLLAAAMLALGGAIAWKTTRDQ